MIKTLLIVCRLSTHGWQLNLPIFSSVQIAIGPPERSKSSARNLAMCETWITFKGLWYNHIITKGDFKSISKVSADVFWRLQQNLIQTLFLEVCHYTGLQQLHNAPNRNTLKRLIHTYHAVPMPRQFTHAVLCPCHALTVPCPWKSTL